MLYYAGMGKPAGYEITEADIVTALNYLKSNVNKNASREEAITYLEEKHAISHMAAHKIVEDERAGIIKPVRIKKTEK